ncbi:MAG: conjugal transfer protein TrbF [Caulobacter sp.]|nr:conjugal transfer protein TrbF [Caulobacter sp.]
MEPAAYGYRPEDPQIAWHLAQFIQDVRGIPADPVVLRQDWLRAYNYTIDKGAQALNDYARAADPFGKIGRIQVAVDVSSVIRASPTSFRVAWTERRYEDGAVAATERWIAILTIVPQPPHDADGLRKNPLGACGPARRRDRGANGGAASRGTGCRAVSPANQPVLAQPEAGRKPLRSAPGAEPQATAAPQRGAKEKSHRAVWRTPVAMLWRVHRYLVASEPSVARPDVRCSSVIRQPSIRIGSHRAR